MIIPNLEYHQGVCAWLDGKKASEDPYLNVTEYPKSVEWFSGWMYANRYYGELNYGRKV